MTRDQERRALAIALAIDAGDLTQREIAREFGCSLRLVSLAARLVREASDVQREPYATAHRGSSAKHRSVSAC